MLITSSYRHHWIKCTTFYPLALSVQIVECLGIQTPIWLKILLWCKTKESGSEWAVMGTADTRRGDKWRGRKTDDLLNLPFTNISSVCPAFIPKSNLELGKYKCTSTSIAILIFTPILDCCSCFNKTFSFQVCCKIVDKYWGKVLISEYMRQLCQNLVMCVIFRRLRNGKFGDFHFPHHHWNWVFFCVRRLNIYL